MPKIKILIIALILLLSSGAWAESAENYLKQGHIYLKSRNYSKAEELYKKAIETNPKYFDAYVALGLVYASKKEDDKAIEAYQKALEINLSPEGFYKLSLVYTAKKKYDKSIECLKKAVELNPKYTAAYLQLASIYVIKEDFDSAIEWYKKSADVMPNATAYHRLGLIYAGKENYNAAVKCYTNAIKLNPNYTQAYLWLGQAYYNTGDTASALKQVVKLRELRKYDLAFGLEKWIKEKGAQAQKKQDKSKKR